MKSRASVGPLSDLEMMELYPLMVVSIEEDNNPDAKNSQFFEEDNNSSTNPWDNDLSK